MSSACVSRERLEDTGLQIRFPFVTCKKASGRLQKCTSSKKPQSQRKVLQPKYAGCHHHHQTVKKTHFSIFSMVYTWLSWPKLFWLGLGQDLDHAVGCWQGTGWEQPSPVSKLRTLHTPTDTALRPQATSACASVRKRSGVAPPEDAACQENMLFFGVWTNNAVVLQVRTVPVMEVMYFTAVLS